MKDINEENSVADCKTKEELLNKVDEVQTAMTAAAEKKLLRRTQIKRNNDNQVVMAGATATVSVMPTTATHRGLCHQGRLLDKDAAAAVLLDSWVITNRVIHLDNRITN